ncbi:MAG: hypothetical protein EOM73_09520, partial [Bacteroidia bacterium]|nr:hypothetical protein [Bacteroidia bacterium]
MTINDKIKLSQNTAVFAGIFCISVALLLLLNFVQLSKNDPIESKALQALVERLREDPNNGELKTEIRNFDLLARKAYFNSQWQVKTGSYLLLFGAVVLALALRSYYSLKSKIEQPDPVLENEIASRILAQRGIIIVGIVVLALAFGASFLTVNHLNSYQVETETAQAETTPQDQGIQVIEVGEVPQEATGDTLPVETAEVPEQQISPAESQPVAEPTTAETVSSGFTLADLQKNHNSFRGPLAQGLEPFQF